MTSRFARTGVLAAAAVAALGIAGTAAPVAASSDATDVATDVSGSITVLTNRTDIVDTVFADYADQFNQIYPDVDVKFEAITDYEGEVKIRMNTDGLRRRADHPNDVTADQLPEVLRAARHGRRPRPDVPLHHRAGVRRPGVRHRPDSATPTASSTTRRLGRGRRDRRADDPRGVRRRPASDRRNTDAVPLYTNYDDGWPLTPVGGQPRLGQQRPRRGQRRSPTPTPRGPRAPTTT